MKNGTCPRCGSTEVYDGSRAAKGQLSVPHSVPLGTVSRAVITDLVCGACGYMESYILDADALTDIAKRWPRVEASEGRHLAGDELRPPAAPGAEGSIGDSMGREREGRL